MDRRILVLITKRRESGKRHLRLINNQAFLLAVGFQSGLKIKNDCTGISSYRGAAGHA